MKLTLEMASRYAYAADNMVGKLRVRLDMLKNESVKGPPGRLGFNTVADVVKHLKMREKQINELTAEIAELETTDTDSDTVLEIADRLGLSI